MKVILLSGAPNSGKTTTLNKVYDELIGSVSKSVSGQAPSDSSDMQI